MAEIIYHPPVPCNASAGAIRMFAEKLRKESNLKHGFELLGLMKINGGKVEEIPVLEGNQEDALVVDPSGNFTVRVSPLSSGLRNNFIMAHELGHYVMHWPKTKDRFPGAGMKCLRTFDADDKNMMKCESEANTFAMSFLMPEQEFRDFFVSKGAYETSSRFAVTCEVVEKRAQRLGISTDKVMGP